MAAGVIRPIGWDPNAYKKKHEAVERAKHWQPLKGAVSKPITPLPKKRRVVKYSAYKNSAFKNKAFKNSAFNTAPLIAAHIKGTESTNNRKTGEKKSKSRHDQCLMAAPLGLMRKF